MTPTLSTANLILRPLTKATARNVGWLRDPDVVRFSEQKNRQHTLSSQLRYLGQFGGSSHIWGIYLAVSDEHIGNITAQHDDANNVSDVGVLIGETRQWGKGYGHEAWVRVCGWLLDPGCGNVRKLEAGCTRNNEAMLKIIRGCGFKEEGERLNHFLFDGNPVGVVLFGRMR